MKPHPLETLRAHISPEKTLTLGTEATQALWDECQRAEDEIEKLELDSRATERGEG